MRGIRSALARRTTTTHLMAVLALTFVTTWPRLADWGDAALPGFVATGAVVLGTRPALDNAPARLRHGLVGMTERVRVLGGVFTAGPRPDGGFRVVAGPPLHGEDTA